MPNKKGGKAYKKGKGEEEMLQFVDILPGQYMARALRILGDRNILCYCDDNVVRICHIRKTMKKGSARVETGDMVLVSLRDFSAEDPKTIKRGDILAKYPPEQVRLLKREGNVNERLFMKLEDGNGISISAVGEDKTNETIVMDSVNDDGFDFESGSEEESEEESEESETKIVSKKDKVRHRGERAIRGEDQIEEKGISLDDL